MAKLRSLCYVQFLLPILFVLALALDGAVLYRSVEFSEKWYSSFLRKAFVFQKTCFRVTVMKTFKIPSDCHIKICRSLKRRAILKSLLLFFFSRNLCSFCVRFEVKPLRLSVSPCQSKNRITCHKIC